MLVEQMATKAPTLASDSEALVFTRLCLVTDPCYVHTTLYALLCVSELPRHHLLCSRRGPNLLDKAQDLLRVVCLNHNQCP
jgi:hypothetical protein